MVDIERLDEIRCRVHDRSIHSVEGDLLRSPPHTGHVEDGLPRHAAPARTAHRAVAQLTAGNARIGKSAAVARTLIDRDEFNRRQLSDVLQR
jgi:hypothetical protein